MTQCVGRAIVDGRRMRWGGRRERVDEGARSKDNVGDDVVEFLTHLWQENLLASSSWLEDWHFTVIKVYRVPGVCRGKKKT